MNALEIITLNHHYDYLFYSLSKLKMGNKSEGFCYKRK